MRSISIHVSNFLFLIFFLQKCIGKGGNCDHSGFSIILRLKKKNKKEVYTLLIFYSKIFPMKFNFASGRGGGIFTACSAARTKRPATFRIGRFCEKKSYSYFFFRNFIEKINNSNNNENFELLYVNEVLVNSSRHSCTYTICTRIINSKRARRIAQVIPLFIITHCSIE